jgi:hypothetical protein
MANDEFGLTEPKPHADTDAGLDLLPQNIEAYRDVLVDAPDSVTAPAYRSAWAALEKTAASVAAIAGLARELRNQSQVPGASPDAAATSAMGASFSRASTMLARAHADINDAAVALTGKITAATQNPRRNEVGASQTASEIRAYVKSLPNEQRMSFLMNAADHGDREELWAIMQGGPFVSGFDRQKFALAKEFTERALAPTECAQRDTLQKLATKLENAGSTMLQRYSKSVPKENPQTKRKSEALKKVEAS